MNLLSAEKISKSFSEKKLLDEISIGINEGEKIGIIGINGTGKSTLLKIIAGVEKPDSGRIISGNGIKIGYLPQNPDFEEGLTVMQQVFSGDTPVMSLLREYEETLQKFNDNPGDAQLEKKLISLSQRMDAMEAWTIESEAKTILTKLGIHDFGAEVDKLSGGQRKRIAIATVLINPSDLLILDEPTNHIDNDTVAWLEKYLNNRKGALLMVTHDRYFLDRVVNRIVELDRGRIFSYQANYSKYLEMKIEREENEQSTERKRQSFMKKELEWIKKGPKARGTKQKARIDRFEKMVGEDTLGELGNVEINVGSSRLGRKIIEIDNIHKSYDGTDLIGGFNYILLRDDRIGIIGSNGCGKSTLLKMIGGRLNPDKGTVVIGETVKIGYFAQENDEMNENLRVIEYIREEAEFLTTLDGVVTASQMLEKFLFPPEVQWGPISKLSGGEKRRLYLLRILMGAPNILMLDEPTNDLDIQTLNILEAYIDEFPGAVVVVSHDRYFLDRVTSRLFSFEEKGKLVRCEGNYSDYREARDGAELEATENVRKAKAGDRKENGDGSAKNPEDKKERPLKFSFKEQKEYEQIDEKIGSLENSLKEISHKINEAGSNYEELQTLTARQQELENELNEAMERWVYLNELAEEIARNKKSGI